LVIGRETLSFAELCRYITEQLPFAGVPALYVFANPISMQILLYNELNPKQIPGFSKMVKYLEADDFKSAEVKKVGDNLYRARLNQSDRLLFSVYRHQGCAYALILEYIKHHAYEDSRFLRRAAAIDESKISAIDDPAQIEGAPLAYLNPHNDRFNLLDKIISFDDHQQATYQLQPPLVIIGSAGSGKTALTLEKMKQTVGDVLYVTQSAYLVRNSRDLYYAHDYENPDQQADFLSFQEFLESIEVPDGKPVAFPAFQAWFGRQRHGGALKDAHKIFEEFRGVITGPATDKSWLSREDYQALGVKESIFLADERAAVYETFEKYLKFLAEQKLYDPNVVSHQYLPKITPRYDFVVVDEVQDLTNVQLYLILKALRRPEDFILCGDSNQIVHPNFFSWSKVKSLFYRQADLRGEGDLIRILNTNYRNSPQVTEIANRILKIKNQRFGSIDKESHYLVESNGHVEGEVLLLEDSADIRRELDNKTRTSTLFAVIVMNAEQKPEAVRHFSTPLVFTIQEAKGLEYENIILYNFLTLEEGRYREIAKGVNTADLAQDLKYARGKDKTDKSLEVYKFYVNALYVALTRAIRNLYWIESNARQPLLDLLGLREVRTSLTLANQNSSLDAWRLEAHKLELQGKQEQADRIRSEILKQKTPNWQVLKGEALAELKRKALEANDKNAKLALFEYALVYEDLDILNALLHADFKPARQPDKGLQLLEQKHYAAYQFKKPDAVLKQTDQYGPDFRNVFNQTPLMVAAWTGNAEVVKALVDVGADPEKVDGNGLTAFQIALAQADRSDAYAKKKLAAIYGLLEPTSMSIQVEHRLIKLDKSSMEFFLLNLMVALFYRVMPKKMTYRLEGFTTQDFIDAIEHMPAGILPERRKQRAYLSAILAKNEIEKDDRYNRRLFYRVMRGHYIFNPNLAIRVEGEWINIYDLLNIDKLAPRHDAKQDWWRRDYNEILETWMRERKAELKLLLAERRDGRGSG
jgi:hypothetical protein